MEVKKYRDYYERLAREREKQRVTHHQGERNLWSLAYRDSFKGIMFAMINRRMAALQNPLILDVGCGLGFDLHYILSRYPARAVGSDLSITRLEAASKDKVLKDCRFYQADAQQLPFGDESFDIAICSEVIEHLPDPEMCLRDMYRVLKKGGLLFLTTPNRGDYFHMFGQLIPRGLRRRIARFLSGGDLDIDSSQFAPEEGMREHIHLFRFGELKSCLKRSGFFVEEISAGALSVPAPGLFDRSRILQRLWRAFDKSISVIPISKYIKATIILTAKKEPQFDQS